VVELLLDKGADILAADEVGFICACMSSLREIMPKEWKIGLLCGQEGVTALKSAVQGNHGEVAAVLVERGANPNDVYKVSDYA